METERHLTRRVQPVPVTTRRFEHRVGADDVGFDEGLRAIDRAVHVGLGGQVHHRIRLQPCEQFVQRRLVADVHLTEPITRRVGHIGQRLEIAGVGQFVDVDHFAFGLFDQKPHHGRANEARAPCH
jgi:hypothetical protein